MSVTSMSEEQLDSLVNENRRLKRAFAGLICWAGESPEGPSWATPEARQKNRAMFEAALKEACDCFPQDFNGCFDDPAGHL